MNRITVLLAEDHAIVREGLRALLELSDDFEIVGEAATGRQAVDMARKFNPTVVVMDIAMPLLNGFEAARQIRLEAPTSKVLVLSAHSDDEYVAHMLAIGASGYLLKQNSGQSLVLAVKAVARGGSYFSPSIAKRLRDADRRSWSDGSTGSVSGQTLTTREAEVLQLVAEGAANKQIAAAIVPSNYSPEAVGMSAAAHHEGRRVVYANHAPVPANGAVVPPVLADCALFYGGATTRTYQRRSRCLAEVAYIGQPGTPRAMQWREALDTVGIFLTAGTKAEVLKSLIASIRLDLPDARIIVRQHPVTLLKTDFSTIGVDDPNTELTIGNPLDDEIAACDLVICGNSGVSMNVLSGGRPVAYLSSLDNISFDANGFVASRLVLSVPWWTDDIYSRLKGFYQTPGWIGVMQSYDASYGADLVALHHEAGQVLMRHLRPRPTGPEQHIGTDLTAPEPLRVA